MYKQGKRVCAAISAGVVLLAVTAPARAVPTGIDGLFYDLPAGSDKNVEAVRALIAASDALGMTRRGGMCPSNANCLGAITASHEYRGNGTWNGIKSDLVVVDFDYRLPAVRTDITGADKKRVVTVAANGLAWDEKTPGVFDKQSIETVADRLVPVYLLPHAVVYFGGLAADKVKVNVSASGIRTLTIPLPAPVATNLVAVLDAKDFPVHTEIALAGRIYTGDFANFTNDHMENDVHGPAHILEKVNGDVTSDLSVEYHWTDPYMVFPTPKQIAAKASVSGSGATVAAPVVAQAVPRTRDGHPDFTGLWVSGGSLPSGADSREVVGRGEVENAQVRGLQRMADLNRPVYWPQHWETIKENDYDGDVAMLDPSTQCLPQGLPRISAPSAIVQVPDQNLIIFRYQTTTTGGRSEARFIPTDGRQHTLANVTMETWYGDSVGHWEGDTLVIETIGFTDQSWLSKSGYIHGTQMKVTERLTRSADTFTWTATVEDPEYLQQPWTITPVTRTLNTDPIGFLPEDLPCSTEYSLHIVGHQRT
jgi:hypothetical protein